MSEPVVQVNTRLPEARASELFTCIRELLVNEIEPQAAEREEAGQFPRELFALLSKEGLLALPFAAEYGGGAQPFAVYLRVLEELAAAHLTVGLGVSVHTLACHAAAEYGTAEQRSSYLPDMLTGGLLGAYCLSEASAGSSAPTPPCGPPPMPSNCSVVSVTHGSSRSNATFARPRCCRSEREQIRFNERSLRTISRLDGNEPCGSAAFVALLVYQGIRVGGFGMAVPVSRTVRHHSSDGVGLMAESDPLEDIEGGILTPDQRIRQREWLYSPREKCWTGIVNGQMFGQGSTAGRKFRHVSGMR